MDLTVRTSVEQLSTQQKRTGTDSKKDKSEDSNSRRPTTAESRGRKRTRSEASEESELKRAGQVEKLKTSKGYPASGLKSSLHGTVYQLKLLMLFLMRGLAQGYSFNLATEMDAAEKFDDVVFQYTEGGEEVYRFLQAKHKQDDNTKITVNDLLTEQDDFSLQKYFISYRKIKQNPEFKSYKLKDFVICTNIDLEESLRHSFEPVEGEDNILRFNGETSERLKLKIDKFSYKKVLVSKLRKTSERDMLAKRLAECILENKPLDLKDNLFRSYHVVLGEKVIDVKNVQQRKEKGKVKEVKKSYAKFLSNFLDGSSQELENFRSSFLKAYQEMSKEQIGVNEFWQKMKPRELQISQNFGKVLANEMSVADQDVVNLKREKEKGVIKDSINKLASLPDDDIGEEEIECFFEKLVFAVNQPNEIELGDIIKAEMGEDKYINLIDSELIASKFQEDVLNWMKEKKGRFLTHEDGKAFFKEAKQIISKLTLIGPSLEYRAKIEDFGIAFSKEPSGLSNFLASQEKQFFNLINPYNTTLSSIKVFQTLKDITKYQKYDSHIFVRLSSLLRMKDDLVKAFESRTSNNLLVIECNATEKNVDELYHQLSKVLRSCDDKKTILITQENDPLADKFKSKFSKDDRYEEEKDERNNFIDLKDESQEKLLNKGKVVFQGEEVCLDTLIDERSKCLIDGEVLPKLINNEKIEIGKALIDSKYNDIKDYYIDRTFNRHVNIKESFKKEKSGFSIFDNGQFTGSHLQQNDIVVISDIEEGFTYLRNKLKERNIHWLKNDGREYLWQKSYGVLSKLRKFVDSNEQSIQEYKPKKITDINDRVVIIAAEPGMGKSTMLTHLGVQTKESNPSLWIVRINLLDYSAELEGLGININETEAIKFVYRTIDFKFFQKDKEEKQRAQMIENVLNSITVKDSKISLEGYREKNHSLNSLEIELFNYLYNQGNITLLFDGFDEISPDYKEKVIKLLQVLKNTKVEKIWVTTRPYGILNQLEDKLNTFSYTLKPLSSQDQRRFLEKFWKENSKLSELDDGRLSIFTDKLIEMFSQSINDKESVFLTIPLQTWMIARIFQDSFEEWYGFGEQKLSDEHKQKFSEEINLIALYDKFIDIKFRDIRFREKNPDMNTAKPDMKRIVEEAYKKFIADHGKLAVYAIFKADEVGKLLDELEICEVRNLIEDIEQGKENSGIIERVVDNKPVFIHRSYAEYFVVKLISDRLKSKYVKSKWVFLINIIFNEDHHNIRRFFESKLTSDHELANLSSKKRPKAKILNFLLKGKKNPLCAAAKEGLVTTVDFLLKSAEGDLDKLIKIINTSGENGSPLCLAIENGHSKIVEILLKYIKDVDQSRLVEIINHNDDGVPLFLAVRTENSEIVNILLKDIEDIEDLAEILSSPKGHSAGSALNWIVTNHKENILKPYIKKLSFEQIRRVLNATEALYEAVYNINFSFFYDIENILGTGYPDVLQDVPLEDMPIDRDKDGSMECYEYYRLIAMRDSAFDYDDNDDYYDDPAAADAAALSSSASSAADDDRDGINDFYGNSPLRVRDGEDDDDDDDDAPAADDDDADEDYAAAAVVDAAAAEDADYASSSSASSSSASSSSASSSASSSTLSPS